MRLVARSSYISELNETLGDFISASHRLPLVLSLAIQDIKTRYRGSVIGPWWITITTAAMVLGIGLSYGPLFGRSVSELLPYVAVGIVVWSYLSMTISDGGESFVQGAAMLRQSSLPLPLFVIRGMVRNAIILGHQIIIIAAVLFWFRIFNGIGILLSFVGMILLILNLSWVSTLLAIISSKFRDVPQIVTAVLQFVFFLSPIFWVPTKNMENSFFILDNPIYLAIQGIRDPLLHGFLSPHVIEVLLPLAIIGWVITLATYTQTRRRVVHYL